MKLVILLVILFVATGCQRGKIPDGGDAALDTPSAPPPKDDPRTACPPNTEMQGGPDEFQEWCQKSDGTLQGRHTIWHKNSYKAAEGDYVQNLKRGKWSYWHPNGQKASEGSYQLGKRQGAWSFWHENGQVAESGSYQDGLEDGQWTSYDENGEKTSETEFNKGMQLRR